MRCMDDFKFQFIVLFGVERALKNARHCEPVRTLAWQSPSIFREFFMEEIVGFICNLAHFTTLSRVAPPHGIATPVCALVRDDVVFW